jgi:hypothetical protein
VSDNYNFSTTQTSVPYTYYRRDGDMETFDLNNYLSFESEYTSFEYTPTGGRSYQTGSYDYETIVADEFSTFGRGNAASTICLRAIDINGNYVDIAMAQTTWECGTIRVGGRTYSKVNECDWVPNPTASLFIQNINLKDSKITYKASAIIEYYTGNQYPVFFQAFRDTVFIQDISSLNTVDDIKIEIYYKTRKKNDANKSNLRYHIGGNITNTLDNSVYLSELIDNTTFREGADKYVITVSDKELKELNDPTKKGELASKFLSKNIEFIGFGNSTNITQFNNFINGLNIFISITFFPCISAINLTISEVFTYSLFCGKNKPLSLLSIISLMNSHRLSICSILLILLKSGKKGKI